MTTSNPTSVARVRADEALAKAREEEEERIQDKYDTACRFAKLRGLPTPSPPEPLPALQFSRTNPHAGSDPIDRDPHKRQRRRHGEDDTDRDIRYARENAEAAASREDKWLIKDHHDKNAKINDHAGNIQLFAPSTTRDIRAQKSAEAETEKTKKDRQPEEQYTMRLSSATGNHTSIKDIPWYSSISRYSGTEELDDKVLNSCSDKASSGLDAFGREDPGRVARDARRRQAADPMTAIMAGQVELKQRKAEQERRIREREHELRSLKLEEKERRRERRLEERRQREYYSSSNHSRRYERRNRDVDEQISYTNRPHKRSDHPRATYRSRDENYHRGYRHGDDRQ